MEMAIFETFLIYFFYILYNLDSPSCHPVNPCQNGGKCSNHGYAVSCWCKNGYGGRFCEKRISRPSHCKNI